MLYNAFVKSSIAYCCPVWIQCSRTAFNRIQRLMNKSIKSLHNLPFMTPTETVYKQTEILTLNELSFLENTVLIYKIMNKLCKSNFSFKTNKEISGLKTRNQLNLHLYSVRTNRGKLDFLFKAAADFNKLPLELKLTSGLRAFVRGLKAYLQEERAKHKSFV